MKTFKQFQEDVDKDMLGVYGALGGATALGIKALQKVGEKATSMNTAKKLKPQQIKGRKK